MIELEGCKKEYVGRKSNLVDALDILKEKESRKKGELSEWETTP
jgi:hypothetical protein